MDHLLERKLQAYVTLPDTDRAALSSELRAVSRVPAHADIAREGEATDTVHVLLDGWAGRCRRFIDGRRQIVSLLVPGDCGDWEVPFLDRRDYALVALTPVAVAAVPGAAVRGLEERSAVLKAAILTDMLAMASIQTEMSASLGRRSAIERMAHLFCELQVRLAARDLLEGTGFMLPISQDNLADVLGMSSVHINRTLMDLRALGLISLRDKVLTIHDAPALGRLAYFDPGYLQFPSSGAAVRS